MRFLDQASVVMSTPPAGRIRDVRATTVAVPLEAPLRHANGVHPGYFVRTLVEVETDEGLVGLGEVGGGGNSAAEAIHALRPTLLGEDPYALERLRWKCANPVQALYVPLQQMFAAVEFACLDIQGQAADRPLSDLIGGRLRERIPFAAYLFYRHAAADLGGERDAETMLAHAAELVARCGFRTLKLKGGVHPPDHDVEVVTALRRAFPTARLRLDPNSIWPVEEAIRVAKRCEPIGLEYLEDPTWGLAGMARVSRATWIPTATNTVVVNFDQVPAAIALQAVGVILVDPHFWGGILGAKKLAGVAETFNLGLGMHSGGELGVSLAAMLHFAAATPNLAFAADAHYHHLRDDVIAGGPFRYDDGTIAVPTGPGLGVRLDGDKVARYAEAYARQGAYDYHRDPRRPGWFAVFPGEEERYAAPGT